MHSVLNTKDNQSFKVKNNDILFDALDKQGVKLPHGCLAGSCGACKIIIEEGVENLKVPSLIEQNTLDAIIQNHERLNGKGSLENKTIRLSCRAKVLGDVKFRPL